MQWSTGYVGSLAVRAIAARPDLELTGVWVHSPDKAGRDAGELAGIAPLGVAATTDAGALLAQSPDCVCYTASGESRPGEAVDDLCGMLERGINVVTTSIPGLLYPPGYDSADVARLEDACRKGGASLYSSGIEPGFSGDHLVLVLATLTRRIRSVRTQEIFTYADYPVPFTIFEVFGFGKPPEHRCIMELPGVQRSAWGPPVQMVADRLGVELSEIRETYDKRVTDTFTVDGGGNDRGGDRRRGALRDDRGRRRPRRHRDRARQPHGRRPRTRLADRGAATARTGSSSTANRVCSASCRSARPPTSPTRGCSRRRCGS